MRPFKKIPIMWLAVISICTVMWVMHYSPFLHEIVLEAIAETQKYGLPLLGIICWFLIGVLAASVSLFTYVSACAQKELWRRILR